MTTLFNIEKTFSGNLVTLARPVTRDDVVLVDVTTAPDENLRRFIGCGKIVELKQSRIDELLNACDIEVNDDGRYRQHSQVTGLTAAWDSREPTRYGAYLQRSVEFRGLRNKEAKLARVQSEFDAMQAEFERQQDEMIDAAIGRITDDINTTIKNHNAKVSDGIRNIIVNLRVDNIESFLNEREQIDLNILKAEQANLEEQIKELRDKLKEKSHQTYQLKRRALTNKALRQLGEQGQAIVNSLADVEQDSNEVFTL